MALLWSAHPQLVRDIAATKTILQNTANPDVTVAAQTCGGTPSTQIPNNSFGYGRVDAYAAFFLGVTPTPTPTTTPTRDTHSQRRPDADSHPTPTPTPTSTPTPAAQAVNISTRLRVETGDNAWIGGFIVTGTHPKNVLLRAIGPSLTVSPACWPIRPWSCMVRLGFATVTNNNWQDDRLRRRKSWPLVSRRPITSNQRLMRPCVPEPIPRSFSGNDDTTGIGLVEVYDLARQFMSKLANISTRAWSARGTIS